ncbi:hypothetical protein J31TS4_14910 [Paenibacillus sp. J31TS4]|nr:hypothetical protein J31TS4_14910 [Paenibacillus sp. J31TS4]
MASAGKDSFYTKFGFHIHEGIKQECSAGGGYYPGNGDSFHEKDLIALFSFSL